jgi:hypothetical protein
MALKELSRSRGAFGWWEENDEERKKGNVRSVLLERTHIIASIAASTKDAQ